MQIVIPTAEFGDRVDGLLADLSRELRANPDASVAVMVVDAQELVDVTPRLLGQGDPIRVDAPNSLNGPGVNRNRGATGSSSQWLVFLDDDVRVPAGWLTALVRLIEGPDPADLIGGGIGSQVPSNWFSQAAEDFVVRHREYPEGWYLAAAHLIVRRSAFEALGGFDETFDYGGEDWDLSRRAHGLGLRVSVDSTIVVAHANARTWKELRRKAEQYGRANVMLDADDAPVEASAVQPAQRISLGRGLRWVAAEYSVFRGLGRSRSRALRSAVLQAAWMRSYFAAYQEALAERVRLSGGA